MKLLSANLFISQFFASVLTASPDLITNIWLNDQAATEIPVGIHRVTTLSFPRPPQSIDATGVTTDSKTTGSFQLAHSPNQSSIALRALVTGATANVNVRLDNRTYVILLTESRTPVLSANFLAAVSDTGKIGMRSGPSPGVSTSALLGLLDKARNYEALRKSHPQVVSDVQVAHPRSTNDYEAFVVVLEDVFRFDVSDALVFRVSLRSKTAQEVRYRSGSWAVRVGDRLYPQALADGSGVIPAEGEETVWFVIQGSPDGGRNGISPRNRFIVLLNPL